MQVPAEVRKCVAFLVFRTPEGKEQAGGTVFFVSRGAPSSDRVFVYAVTAKHCIQEIRGLGLGTILIRVNLKGNKGTRSIEARLDDWLFHPSDESVDVAVTRIILPPDANHLVFPTEGFADSEFISRYQIGTGDEVFLPGLFRPHQGTKSNIPIVRIGNTAAMPEEPVNTSLGPMKAYLVECRSIGGLSGSPVFVSPGLHRIVDGEILTLMSDAPSRAFRLIGIMHGHFGVDDSGARERVNMGIAIVNSWDKILEVLNHPYILKYERETLERLRREALPEMDGGFSAQ